jgi:hypothetical protein
MQFTDMSHVRSVDKEMLGHTRAWLLSRRDGMVASAGTHERSILSAALRQIPRAPISFGLWWSLENRA